VTSEFRQAFDREVCPHIAIDGSQIERLEAHYSLMLRWNERLNLTARVGLKESVVRHYGESLFLAQQINGETIADIGSGPGFPGIPIAIFRPHWNVTLVEVDRRKAVFLRESTQGLPNVKVHVGRHDTLEDEFDWVVSRAVRAQDAVEAAILTARRVALICAGRVAAPKKINWHKEIEMPWVGSGVILIGDVPRETSTPQ
jgi:16S rRNA (guanine527-N7)-methyltransferase